ncbi:hypothetical protein JKP88DRAFT_241049 [Tribonema minus]|uniref:Transposase n=1 Tax=Tribonema minus TaxID=303371 RepID=A0A835Z394_9STRA|nr:hypothetical protein JKP88DRAFT_241049 [Tribonema minus]
MASITRLFVGCSLHVLFTCSLRKYALRKEKVVLAMCSLQVVVVANEYKRDFILRTSDVFTKQYGVSVTAHVIKSFTLRIQDHLMCYLERLAWERRNGDHFSYVIKTGAKLLQRAGAVQEDDTAINMVEEFIVRPRGREGDQRLHEDWRGAMETALKYVRDRLSPFRVIPPGGFGRVQVDDDEEDDDDEQLDEMGAFFKNIYRNKSLVLETEAAFRSEDEQFRLAKEGLWTSINNDQPYLPQVMTKEDARKQLPAFRDIEPPAWIQDGDGPLSTDQKVEWGVLVRRISATRRTMVDSRRTPGTLFPPKRFTLLPMAELHPMMLPLDSRIVTSIVALALDNIQPSLDIPTKKHYVETGMGTSQEWKILQQKQLRSRIVRREWKARLEGGMMDSGWWLCMFNLHEKVRLRMPRRAEVNWKPAKPLGRKGKTAWGGIRCLWGTGWTIEDDLSKHGNKKPPWFVNNITTDGLQVNVTLATKVVDPVIPGVADLVKKGYTSIKEVYDPAIHTRGLFGSAAKMSGELLSAVNEKDPRCFVEIVGVDPGQKLLYKAAAARVTSNSSAEDFKNIETASRSASDHRFLSLSKAYTNFDKERRRDNMSYRTAIAELSGVSMRTPGGTAAYANTLHTNFKAMTEEKLSWGRRCKSFDAKRAKMREIARMAREIGGKSSEAAALRKVGPESEERAALLSRMRDRLAGNHRTWTRVAFFGNAQFGHGSRGPLPRKALIRAIALLVPVVLMDEFRTSMTCCGCGMNLVQVDSSRVYQCASCTPESVNQNCSVRFIDRDVNASVNIGMCGIRMLLGMSRPLHLCRTARGEEAE